MIPNIILRLWRLAFWVNQPDLDGGSGDAGPPNGGGVPGTGTGSSQAQAFPANEVGGVLGVTYFLFIPVQSIATTACYIAFFDATSFDDKLDGSSYAYRMEDVAKDRVPTVNRVVLTYRDLGLAQLTVTIKGTNDNGQVVQNSVNVQIGNAIPTNALLTRFVDIAQTCFRPQLILTRAAGGGPVCITQATMRGEVEENQ